MRRRGCRDRQAPPAMGHGWDRGTAEGPGGGRWYLRCGEGQSRPRMESTARSPWWGGGGSCVKWGGPWGALCRSPGTLGSQGRWKVASEGGKGHRGFRKWVGVSLCHVLGSAGGLKGVGQVRLGTGRKVSALGRGSPRAAPCPLAELSRHLQPWKRWALALSSPSICLWVLDTEGPGSFLGKHTRSACRVCRALRCGVAVVHAVTSRGTQGCVSKDQPVLRAALGHVVGSSGVRWPL